MMHGLTSFIVPTFAELAALCWFYRLPILFVNFALSVTVFGVMLWLHREWLKEEDWVRYFSMAFGVFSGVYLLRLSNALMHPTGLQVQHAHVKFVDTVVNSFG